MRQFINRNSNDPIFFIGTRAELIKVAPVITRLTQSGIPIKLLWAGLHADAALGVDKFERVSQYSLRRSKKDQDSIFSICVWFLKNLIDVITYGLAARVSRHGPKVVVVHGDTLCTVLGSLFAKASGAKLMHIEAGVRSGKFWLPFPEEISRRFVSRLTDLNFAPGEKESQNLIRHRGDVVNTVHNTSRDALSLLVNDLQFGDDGYLVVTLHRAELLSNKKKFAEVVQKIVELSRNYPVKWFVGNHERNALSSMGLLESVTQSEIQLFERSSHAEFVKTLIRAHCVITDSHGLQAECNDSGIPVIVHRSETEYSNPDNSPCVLTNWKVAVFDDFLFNLRKGDEPRGIRSKVVAAEIISQRIALEVSGI